MKKVLLITLCLILSHCINAQVRWGAKAGVNISNMNIKDDYGKLENRVGFHAGGVMEYLFSSNFALQPELIFIHNTFDIKIKYRIDHFDITETYDMLMYQLQLPVNLKYKIGTDKFKFIVNAGPYLGYALSGKIKFNNTEMIGWSSTGVVKPEGEDYDMYGDKGGYNRFDLGIGAGLGIEVNKFTLGLAYQQGLINLSDADNTNSKIGTVQISVGYLF